MKKLSSVKSIISFTLLLAFVFAGAASAQEEDHFLNKHQVGIRLGVWANGGEEPPARFTDTLTSTILRSDIGSTNIYFEAYGAYRLFNAAYAEMSLGFANRGDVTLVEGQREYIGNLIIYPILLTFKYYLPVQFSRNFQTYVQAGGGIYYGRYNVQFTNDIFFSLNEDSGTDFNYVLGGGFEWPVASSIGLEANIKYMPTKFDKDLILISDYKATTITFGIKYFLDPSKD